MGAIKVYCSGCSKSWSYINVGDVEVACAGLTNINRLMEKAQKQLKKAAEKCDADALSFGDATSASMEENLANLVDDADSLAERIEQLRSLILGAAQTDEGTQKPTAISAKADCEEAHRKAAEEAAARAAATTKKTS